MRPTERVIAKDAEVVWFGLGGIFPGGNWTAHKRCQFLPANERQYKKEAV